MAFSSAKLGESTFGNKKVVWGSYNASGVTTGDITTGLKAVDFISVQAGGAAVVADAPTVNETLPLSSGDITIIVTSGSTGYWMAYGHY